MERFILTLIIPFLFCISDAQSQWNKYYSLGTGGFLPTIIDIEQTHDNNIFLIGSELFADYTVFKINKFSGDTIWTKTDSTATKIMRIPNTSDYYILRSNDIFISSENWLSRVDDTLSTVWKRDFELNSEVILDFEVLSDGSAICFGNFFQPGGNVEVFFRRVDENNNVIFLDTTLTELTADDITPNIEILPNDKFILSKLEGSEMTFYKYSEMGVFEDSAKLTIPGVVSEDQVNFAVNRWDSKIATMGILEYDTANTDTLDIAGYYYELDSNLNVTLAYEDTTEFYSGVPGFYTPGGSVRNRINILNPSSLYTIGFYIGTTLDYDFPLGTSIMGSPNIPFVMDYVAPLQYIVAGSDLMNYWAASFTTFINNASEEIEQNEIVVFPIPAIDQLFFKIPDGNHSQASLSISDIQGRTIWGGKMTDGLHTLDVSSYRNGLYFYRIETAEYISKGKFQVNH